MKFSPLTFKILSKKLELVMFFITDALVYVKAIMSLADSIKKG